LKSLPANPTDKVDDYLAGFSETILAYPPETWTYPKSLSLGPNPATAGALKDCPDGQQFHDMKDQALS